MLDKVLKNKVIKNIAWLSGDQILRLATGFFVGAWVARYLQPQQYGLLNYVVAFTGLFFPFANLNDINQIAVRDITIQPDYKDEILGTTFILKLFGSLVAVFLSILSILLLRPDSQLVQLLVVILSISTLSCPFSTIDCWFQQKVLAKYTIIAKNIIFTITTLVRIFLIYFHAPLIAFAGVIALESVLSSIALVIAYKVDGQNVKAWHSSFVRAKQLLKDSWTLILSGFAISIYLRIDQTMLGQIVGDHAVGIYSVAVRLSELCCLLPSAVVTSVIPSIYAAKERSKKEYYEKLQKLFDMMTLMGFSFTIGMSLVSKMLIGVVYGEGYAESSNILIVHIWSILFMFIGFAKNVWIIAENQGIYAMVSSFSGALMNIILNFLLIKKYEAMGCAVATLISYGFTDYITCFIYPPSRKVGCMITNAILLKSYWSSLIRR